MNKMDKTTPDEKGSYKFLNGWHMLKLSGSHYDVGYQHGWLLSDYIVESINEVSSLIYIKTGMNWEFFKENAMKLWNDNLDTNIREEIRGIVEGVNNYITKNESKNKRKISFEDILTWNGYEELIDYWFPTVAADVYKNESKNDVTVNKMFYANIGDHCSAFIATGDYTKDKNIVVAHNSFSTFETGCYVNVIADITIGDKSFKMQTQPGYIHSFTDFYVNNAGIVITETTIGGFSVYNANGIPEFVRSRNAAQNSKNLQDFINIMWEGNTGGYANTWLVGDRNTNEIMRLEMGLKYYKDDRTKNGAFAGFNAPLDPRIRNFECSNSGFADIRRHQGARQVRIPQLLEKFKGNIDGDIAKQIISDHYDVYLNKENPCSRTVCSHYESDAREYMSQPGRPLPFQPQGAVDGIICTNDMILNQNFEARFGSSCGKAFDAKEFLKNHPQFDYLAPYLKDRPTQPWTLMDF